MVFIALVAVLLACAAVIAVRGGTGRAPTRASRAVAVAALVVAVFTSFPVFFVARDDSGLGFALAVSSFPVVVTAAATVASWRTGTPAVVVGWLCSLVLVAYVVVFGLGVGLLSAPPAVLLLLSMVLRGNSSVASRR